jgi:tryptophanyl-tRNA synthetase
MNPSVPFLSGIKPTGDVHIGNYFGAIAEFLRIQQQYPGGLVMIADLHALNQVHNAAEIRHTTRELLLSYLACGLDPAKTTIFRQSDVPQHTELMQVFMSLCGVGLMERAHAYKDALAKGVEPNVGLFTYPILMAADILLYKPKSVPVGKDQQQHVEIAVDLLERFNHTYGVKVFSEPRLLIQADTGVVPGTDGRKMSKSYQNVIGLFDEPELIQKKVAKITTDSKLPTEPKDPDTCNVFALHRLVATAHELAELDADYRKGNISYKGSKDLLAERLIRFTEPIRERRAELEAKPAYLQEVLETGATRAGAIAGATMAEVREAVGLTLNF